MWIVESESDALNSWAILSQVVLSIPASILTSKAAPAVIARETSVMSPVKFTKPGVRALWTAEGNELNMRSAWRRIDETGV